MAGALRIYKSQVIVNAGSGGGALRIYKSQIVTSASAAKLRIYKSQIVVNAGAFKYWNGTAWVDGKSILYWDAASNTWK
jgi:hypothetical protein